MKRKRWRVFAYLLTMYLIVEGLFFVCLVVTEKVRDIRYDPIPSTLSAEQRASLREFLRRQQGERVSQDAVLGWVPISEANSAGMRDNREYERVPPPGIVRISAFGDSFTYGSDVKLEESWARQLAAMAPSVELLNYGVGAYGLDQAYLRYIQLGSDYHPHAVLIGYMSENIGRGVNVFRPFYSNAYHTTIFTKPRFKVEDGQLVLVENPLANAEDYEDLLSNDTKVLEKIGENDYYYQVHYREGRFDFAPSVRFMKLFRSSINRRFLHPSYVNPDGSYNVHSEAFEVTIRIFDAFYRKVLENGAVPIILVFPDNSDQQRSRDKKPRSYGPLLEYFRSMGYRFIDMQEALEPYESRYTVGDLSVAWGHYSALGSGIIAEHILTRLGDWDLLDVSKLKRAARVERQRVIKP